MSKLPRRFGPFLYGVIQSGLTTGIATAIATLHLSSMDLLLIEHWLMTWMIAWVTMLPVVILVSPLIQHAVMRLTEQSGSH